MNKLRLLPLVSLGLMSLSLSACVSTHHPKQVFDRAALLGKWVCKVSESDSGLTLDVELKLGYHANGQSITDMTIRTFLPDELRAGTDLPNPLKVVHRVTGNYVFDGTYITDNETGNELIYSNLPEDVELDDMFDPNELGAVSNERMQVTRLDDSRLGLATDDGELLCEKAH